MKKNYWIIAAVAIATVNAFAVGPLPLRNQMIAKQNNTQLAQAQTAHPTEATPTAHEMAIEQRKEFVDRMTELRDRNSSLDKQAIQLIQDNSALQSQLDQNNLERKRVKVDQKDVKRNIKELEREKNIFEKKDKQRKKIDKLLYGS